MPTPKVLPSCYLLSQLVCQGIGHHGLARARSAVEQHHHASAVRDGVVEAHLLAATLEGLKVAHRVEDELFLLPAQDHLRGGRRVLKNAAVGKLGLRSTIAGH